MKKNPVVQQIAISVVGIILLHGCASNQFVKSTDVPVKVVKTHNVSVERAYTHTVEGGVSVHGSIGRSPLYRSEARGHIDVALVDGEGNIVREKSYAYAPRRVSSRQANSYFDATLTTLDATNVTVRVKYHNQSQLCIE